MQALLNSSTTGFIEHSITISYTTAIILTTIPPSLPSLSPVTLHIRTFNYIIVIIIIYDVYVF